MNKYIVMIASGIAAVLALLFTREKGKRELSEEKEKQSQAQLQSHELKDEVELNVNQIKKEAPHVEVDNNDGRTGIGGRLQ